MQFPLRPFLILALSVAAIMLLLFVVKATIAIAFIVAAVFAAFYLVAFVLAFVRRLGARYGRPVGDSTPTR